VCFCDYGANSIAYLTVVNTLNGSMTQWLNCRSSGAPLTEPQSCCAAAQSTNLYQCAPKLKQLVARFPPRWPGFNPRCGQVGFVVDKVALGQVFSGYFGFPCQSSFHHLLTIGQKWPQYKGLSPTPLAIKTKLMPIIIVSRTIHMSLASVHA
jgi:hypothetical protein